MTQIERPDIPFQNTSKRFRISETDQSDGFSRQYYEMYRIRLKEMKKRVLAAAEYSSTYEFKQIEALRDNEKCLIIGTVIKRISQRPSILKEIAKDEHLIPESDMPETENGIDGIESLVSHEDYLELEDEKQIVKLEGNISMDDVATGVIAGFLGQKGPEDTFIVERIVFPAAAPQNDWPKPMPNATIAIISGLELSGTNGKDKETTAAFKLFTRWINGEMQTDEKETELASRIERVIVAGDSLNFPVGRDISSAARVLRLIPNQLGTIPTIEASEELDHLLSNLTSKIRVDVVAGTGDACPQLWPQQPIHKILFPLAGNSGAALGLRTNPYACNLGGIDILTTSGLNVTDILRTSNIGNSLDVMESILNFQHIAPTAPDTIDGFPFNDRDPLIMERRPHIFICGNQSKPGSRWVKSDKGNTLLVGVSRFSRSQLVTFVDLTTLEVSHKFFGPL